MSVLPVIFFGMSPSEYHEKHFDTKDELQEFLPDSYFFEFELENIRQTTFTATSHCWESGCFSPLPFRACNPIVDIEDVVWTGYVIHHLRDIRYRIGCFTIVADIHGKNSFTHFLNETSSRNVRNINIGGVETFLAYHPLIYDIITGDILSMNNNIAMAFELDEVFYFIRTRRDLGISEEDSIEQFLSIATPAIEGRRKGR